MTLTAPAESPTVHRTERTTPLQHTRRPLQETARVFEREIRARATNKTVVLSTVALTLVAGAGAAVGTRMLVRSSPDALAALPSSPTMIFSTAMVMALFTSLVFSTTSISTGVVEEKSSRVVEILLTKIGVGPLLTGKLAGVGLVSLVQLFLVGGAAVLGFTVMDGWSLIEVELGPTLLWFLVWYLIGYTIFAALTTGLAVTVSRQEDLGSAMLPVNMLLLAMMPVTMYLVPRNLDSWWVHTASYIPLTSSFVMPVRYGYDSVETWQMVLSTAIALVAIPMALRCATVLYRNNALRTGSRVSLSQAFRSDDTQASTPAPTNTNTNTKEKTMNDNTSSTPAKKNPGMTALLYAVLFIAGITSAYLIRTYL